MPPQQNAPWLHGDDAFSNAAAALFEQGLPDPRGLDYREIEIAAGSPWGGGGAPMKTHGWILPQEGNDGPFAVVGNGLVYPVIRVGDPADWHQDSAPIIQWHEADPETYIPGAELSSYPTPAASRMMWLLRLRLGETEAITRIADLIEPRIKADPYLGLAQDWTHFIYERSVGAHERGDDRLALADTRLLAKVQPLIDAEAKRRGLEPPIDYSLGFPGIKMPYLPFLKDLPALLADTERRVASPENPSLPKDGIAALIEDLQNVDAPGGANVRRDPRVRALMKRGPKIVEPLLNALENDQRLTRSVSSFGSERTLVSVSDVAYTVLAGLMRVPFDQYRGRGDAASKKELAAQIRAFWAKLGPLSDVERLYAILKDDGAGSKEWRRVAAEIVLPGNLDLNGSRKPIPDFKMTEKIQFRGESLRDGRTPSVSQLLAQRSDEIAALPHGDYLGYVDAGQMALYLAQWDKTSAVPTLKKRLTRAWNLGTEANDIFASRGNPVERFGAIIAEMTLARAMGGDETAYDEYAAWIRKAPLKRVTYQCDELQKPLAEGAARPAIRAAMDYLFNDPQSEWFNVVTQNNDFWLVENFWKTPLPNTAEFRKQALRGLADQTVAGTITLNPPQNGRSHGVAEIQIEGTKMGFVRSNGRSVPPTPGEAGSLRVCDAYAYFYSQYQNGPKFQVFWPEAKRDAGVLACRRWLEAASVPVPKKKRSS